MDGLTLATANATSTTAYSSLRANKWLFPSVSTGVRKIRSRRRAVWFPRKSKFVVLGSKEEEPKMDQWDQMELKFGRMLGEDPKLTLAKIMARKANPDVSFLEVEKQFYKNKGKIVEIKELPFDVSKDKKPPSSLDGLNLVRPVPKEGFEFPADDKPVAPEISKPRKPVGKSVDNTKRGVPNVILRKPALYVEDDVEDKPSRSRFRIKPNLTLKMRDDQSNNKFSDMTLLRKPEPSNVNKDQESLENAETKVSHGANGLRTGNEEGENKYSGFTLLKKPETTKSDDDESSKTEGKSTLKEQELEVFLRLAT